MKLCIDCRWYQPVDGALAIIGAMVVGVMARLPEILHVFGLAAP